MKRNNLFLSILLTIISFTTSAQNSCGIKHHSHKSTIENLKQLQSVLSPLLEDDCPENVTDQLTLIKENYIDHFKTSAVIKKELFGLQLQDHQSAIQALEVILEDKPTKKLSLAKDCRTVLCVLEKLTGSEMSAYQVLDIYRDTGYTLSFKQLSEKQTQHWNADQIDKTHAALTKMPNEFKKLKALGHIYAFDEKYKIADYMREIGDRGDYQNAGGLASLNWKKGQPRGDIFFNSSVFEHNHSWASETIVHEIAHHFDYQAIVEGTGSSQGKLNGFYDLSGWKDIGPNKWHIDQENACFITDYAQTNPKEHFAETVSYFLSQPIALKIKCPKYYDFVKDKILNGHDPLKKDLWEDFETSLAKHGLDLFQCLEPQLQSYMFFNSNAYYQTTSTGPGSFLTLYEPKINPQCFMELLKPIQADLANQDNYCQMGGMNKMIELTSSKVQTAVDLFLKQNQLFAEKQELAVLLDQCMDEKKLTLECIQNKNYQSILTPLNTTSDIAEWFGVEYASKQFETLSKKLTLFSSNDISNFSKKYANQLMTGCLEALTVISVNNSAVSFSGGFYSSSNPFILNECSQGGANKLDSITDEEVRRLIFNQDHLSKTLSLLNTKVIIPYSNTKLTCRQDEKCRSSTLTKLIQAQPELKAMENELVKIISSKYRN